MVPADVWIATSTGAATRDAAGADAAVLRRAAAQNASIETERMPGRFGQRRGLSRQGYDRVTAEQAAWLVERERLIAFRRRRARCGHAARARRPACGRVAWTWRARRRRDRGAAAQRPGVRRRDPRVPDRGDVLLSAELALHAERVRVHHRGLRRARPDRPRRLARGGGGRVAARRGGAARRWRNRVRGLRGVARGAARVRRSGG